MAGDAAFDAAANTQSTDSAESDHVAQDRSGERGAVAALLGYLNFAAGAPDPTFLRNLNRVYADVLLHGDLDARPTGGAGFWKLLQAFLRNELEQLSRKAHQTQVWIETPYRNGQLLEALRQHCAGTTMLSIAVDLTLPGETIVTLPIAEWRPERLALHKRPAIFSLLAG